MRRSVTLFFALLVTCITLAQDTDYQRRYESGKDLLRQNKHELAREVFRPLMQDTPENRYAAYAHYFYALSSFRAGKPDDARLALQQLLEKYPDWPDTDNGHYLLANIAFEKKDYPAAFNYLDKIRNKAVKEDAEQLKKHYLPAVSLNALKDLQRKYPKDQTWPPYWWIS
jgi:TolA-binding protein